MTNLTSRMSQSFCQLVNLPRSATIKCALACAATLLLLQACGSSDEDQGEIIGFAYVDELDEQYQPYEPALGSAVPAAARAALESADLPYPPFNSHDIKSIGPSGWRDRDQLVRAGVGDVIFNQLWATWQPSANLSLNEPNTFEYDGMVWRIDPVREKQIDWYTSRGLNVTVVLYATPEWARPVNTSRVENVPLIHPHFIAPDNPADFARFAGMIAKRYNGANGNGRVVNFVIQNEINAIDWFNPGCGKTEHPCEIEDRIQSYGTLFNQAYDRIKAEQSEARVFMSFDHHFGKPFYDQPRFASAQQFIERLAPLVAPRKWRLAFHSYPDNLFEPVFGPYDLPKITFGNLGVLAGWLRQAFPDKSHAWDIHLTENGINASDTGSSKEAQNRMLPVATRNVLGTPGIDNFVYHRIQDHENEGSFQPGLHDINDRPKPAWSTWAGNNLYDRNPPQLADGYDDLPYIRLVRYSKPDVGHWASSRHPPEGYTAEASYLLLRERLPNTTLLYECFVAEKNVTRISNDVSCDGQTNFGPVGYSFLFNDLAGSRHGLFSIELESGDHLLTSNPQEAPGTVTVLGFNDATKVLQQPPPVRDLSYYDTNVSAGTEPVAIASQPAAEQVINSLGDCSDAFASCHYLGFTVTEDQNHFLSCLVPAADAPEADIVLNFGNDTFSRSVVVVNQVDRSNSRYSISLPIPANANWATVVFSSSDGAATDQCFAVQSGSLAIGAAQELSDNLLQNGGFENPLTDWELCSNDGSAVFSNNAHLGAQSMTIGNDNCVYQEVEIEPGTEYELDCYASVDESATAALKLVFANRSFQKLLENDKQVNSETYDIHSIDGVAPAGSVYAVASFESAGGTAFLDTCSITAVDK